MLELTRKTKSGYNCEQIEAAIASMSFQVLRYNQSLADIVLLGTSTQTQLIMSARMMTTMCRFSGSWSTLVTAVTPTAQDMDSTFLPLIRIHWRFKNNCGNNINLSFSAGPGCQVNTYGIGSLSFNFTNNSISLTPMAVRQTNGVWLFTL